MTAEELFTRARNYVPRDVRSFKRQIPTLMIIVGVALLLYVGSQYGSMFWEQHQLEKQWAAQQHRPAETGNGSEENSSAAIDDGLTRLTIPKIDLSAVVVEGTTRKKLLLGPGHMEETAAPGSEGNSVITAHRDTFFRHIVELSKGDELVVERNGRTFKYEVVSKRVVKPTDVSVVQPTKDSRLTLITCYPTYYIGPAPERLVVVSKLKDGEASKAIAPVRVSELPGDTSDAAK